MAVSRIRREALPCVDHWRFNMTKIEELLVQALEDLLWAVDGLEYVQKEYAAEVEAAREAVLKATGEVA